MLRAGHTQERGSVLALALLVIILLSLIGLALVQLAADDNVRERIQYRRAQGEWRVRGACKWAAWQMAANDTGAANDYNWGLGGNPSLDFPIAGNDLASTVALTISVPPEDAMMREIRGQTQIVGRTVVARNVIDLCPYPPAGEYAILANGNVTLSGNTSVEAESDDINASVHTNGEWLTVWGSASVEGFGTSVGSTQIKPGSVVPNVNPWGWEATYYAAEPVPVPKIHPESLRGGAGYDHYIHFDAANRPPSGNNAQARFDLDWSYTKPDGTMGTTLVFIDGNWAPKGSYTITGRVTLVVSGDFDPTFGNLGIQAANDGVSELFIVAHNITLAGNGNIRATVYAYDSLGLDLQGTPTIIGQLISNGVVECNGNFTLTYSRPSKDMWPDIAGPEELCYQTRIGDQDW